MSNALPTFTVGQQLGPFKVVEITDDKVCLYDVSAERYRNTKSLRWLKFNSPVLQRIIRQAGN
jgi:hypothetical protein